MIGSQLGNYLVEEKIGEGGMGVVYKARDIRLFRSVAIKILPPHLISHEKNRQRFIHEARAASALNHPNICTLHDIGEENGMQFIVMEFVEGQSLREILKERGCLPEKEVVDIGIKVCHALSAAHEKGIIHRDIKPDNIMLTHDGRVKIMDFGLSKLVNRPYETQDPSNQNQTSFLSAELLNTSMTTFQGTAYYMAPEQIEKKTVDVRTDVFAVGVVFYELLTGLPPFVGKDSVTVMKAILRDRPKPLSESRHAVSRELEAVILKVMAKKPERRYQSLTDLISVLKNRSDERSQSIAFRRSWTVLFSLILLSLFIGFYFTISQNLWKDNVATNAEIRTFPLVISPYYENYPAISTDGSKVAYCSEQNGNMDIWIKKLDGSDAVNITKDHKGTDTAPAWSPDGTKLIFQSERDGGGLFVTSLATNQVSQVSKFGIEPSWSSADGRIAFVTEVKNMGSNEIWVMELSTGNAERLLAPVHEGYRFANLTWSPDGRWLLFQKIHGSRKEIHALSLLTKESFEIFSGKFNYARPAFSEDMKSLYFMTNRGGIVDLWKVRISVNSQDIKVVGEPENKTMGFGIVNYSITGNGEKLVYVKAPFAATTVPTGQPGSPGDIITMPLDPNQKRGYIKRRTLSFGFVGLLDPEFSPDRKWIAFEGNFNGKYDIWISSFVGDSLRNLTDDTNKNTGPSWSPDGKWLAYDSGGGNNAEIRIIPSEGGTPIELTDNDWADWMPDWAPDGKSINYSSNRKGNWDIWETNLDDKREFQLTTYDGFDYGAQWSPNGKWIAFISERDGHNNVWLMSKKGLDFRKITHFVDDSVGRTLGWDPNGTKIYFYRRVEKVINIYACYLNASKIEQFTFVEHELRSMSDFGGLSVQNNLIVYQGGGNIESDIWVIENFDPID